MPELTYQQINDDVLGGMYMPRRLYFVVMLGLAGLIAWALTWWIYQVHWGMGVAGISHPVGWATYIANFVFWVGIAHSGTLISAILHLVRSKWRTAVSRSAEAMTIFAVMTAGLFPMIHLGRVWMFYFILPYPTQRQLWPNFISPLIWDVCAVGTYFTVSVIFFYVGLIPDLAAARDRFFLERGPDNWRTRFYRYLSLGWSGSNVQWHHHSRAYLFFAALATPLVISVHSVVSWDFAMGILPGWHTTIFAPYFVAGAIHSGLAMVLTLLIPLRKLLGLERLITIRHFESVAQTMIVTTLIVGYAYMIEPFISWYSGDLFERQFAWWRATGFLAIPFWLLVPFNVLFPLLFIFKRVRTNLKFLFGISLLVNVGMWLERYVIVIAATAHDFLPHNWGAYFPRPVEINITIGAFAFFLFWFFGFSKLFPTIALSDVKEQELSEQQPNSHLIPPASAPVSHPGQITTGITAVFASASDLVEGVRTAQKAGLDLLVTYSPARVDGAEEILNPGPSPVRVWTLAGALTGLTSGFTLAIYTALVNGLIVGGKHPVSIIPYCIVGFEGTILAGTIFNLIGVLVHGRLGRPRLPAGYNPVFSRDRFGLFIGCIPEKFLHARNIISSARPQEIYDVQ